MPFLLFLFPASNKLLPVEKQVKLKLVIFTNDENALSEVLGQLRPRKIAPNPKTNPNPNPNPNRRQFSMGAIVWLPHNSRTNSNLDPNPNRTGGQLSGYDLQIKDHFFWISHNNYKVSEVLFWFPYLHRVG